MFKVFGQYNNLYFYRKNIWGALYFSSRDGYKCDIVFKKQLVCE